MRLRHLTAEARRELAAAQIERCKNPNLADVVEHNIDTILKLRVKEHQSRTVQERVSDKITDFSGSMAFVYLHALFFGMWIILNIGVLKVKPFDPYPFNFLTMTVSLEAIFLSTFVLISQNRMGDAADKRADLDLQINLLAEHEITKLLILTDQIAKKLGIEEECGDLSQLETDVTPDVVLEQIKERKKELE